MSVAPGTGPPLAASVAAATVAVAANWGCDGSCTAVHWDRFEKDAVAGMQNVIRAMAERAMKRAGVRALMILTLRLRSGPAGVER